MFIVIIWFGVVYVLFIWSLGKGKVMVVVLWFGFFYSKSLNFG